MEPTIAPPQPRARLTGAVYLAYFLSAMLAQFAVGRTPVAVSDAANVVSIACYIAVTVLLYRLFTPFSTRLSLVAALSASPAAR